MNAISICRAGCKQVNVLFWISDAKKAQQKQWKKLAKLAVSPRRMFCLQTWDVWHTPTGPASHAKAKMRNFSYNPYLNSFKTSTDFNSYSFFSLALFSKQKLWRGRGKGWCLFSGNSIDYSVWYLSDIKDTFGTGENLGSISSYKQVFRKVYRKVK